MRALLCAFLVLPCTGCLAHRANVTSAAADPAVGRCVVGNQVRDGAPHELRQGPLPHDLPVTWILRDTDGKLLSAHARLLSPLPWWQRFPADLAVDLWPGEARIDVAAVLVPRPISVRSAADITAEAHAHGYAK